MPIVEIQIEGDDYQVRLTRDQFLLLTATLDEHLLQFGDHFDVNGWTRREAQEFSVEMAERTRVARLGGKDAQLSVMKKRRLIGYWRNEQHPEFPDPASFVDASWDEDERHEVWAYLASGTVIVSSMGTSPCRICGEDNGASEYTDGRYQWPEGLAHYVGEHGVRLPEDVVAHVRARLDSLDAATPSLDWWLAQT